VRRFTIAGRFPTPGGVHEGARGRHEGARWLLGGRSVVTTTPGDPVTYRRIVRIVWTRNLDRVDPAVWPCVILGCDSTGPVVGGAEG
jgi:hypothetical protein